MVSKAELESLGAPGPNAEQHVLSSVLLGVAPESREAWLLREIYVSEQPTKPEMRRQ